MGSTSRRQVVVGEEEDPAMGLTCMGLDGDEGGGSWRLWGLERIIRAKFRIRWR